MFTKKPQTAFNSEAQMKDLTTL